MSEAKPLDLSTYQREALKTDRIKAEGNDALIVALLGLVGEVGTLAAEHKKRMRDKEKYRLFKDRVEEDVGDILWYLANFASKNGMDLEEVARRNLHKVRSRWALPVGTQISLLDEDCKPQEQLPRHFEIDFRVDKKGRVALYRDGERVGDRLTDNNYADDGYRFHDVFHLAYAAVLGWSPVTRKLLKCKRKSDKITDNVEDGGRAAVIEEGVAAMAYASAKDSGFLEEATEVDHSLLDTIQRLTSHLEVQRRSAAEWEKAILLGFRAWRELRQHNGGRVTIDLVKQQLYFASSPANGAVHRRAARSAGAMAPKKPSGKRKPAKRTSGALAGPPIRLDTGPTSKRQERKSA
jgi:NTP pyrophosphatase (non-canonical NTP hydrolase)